MSSILEQLDGVAVAAMLSEDEFWASENAIARAYMLQNPVIMANMLENLRIKVELLEQHILRLEKKHG